MPRHRAPKVCGEPGCINDQPCPIHTPTPWAGSHSSGFPPAIRRRILQRDPTCRCTSCPACGPVGCTRPSTQADHRIPRAHGGPNTLANGQGLCTNCHDHKTKAEAAEGRRHAHR